MLKDSVQLFPLLYKSKQKTPKLHPARKAQTPPENFHASDPPAFLPTVQRFTRYLSAPTVSSASVCGAAGPRWRGSPWRAPRRLEAMPHSPRPRSLALSPRGREVFPKAGLPPGASRSRHPADVRPLPRRCAVRPRKMNQRCPPREAHVTVNPSVSERGTE